ncbi:D-alanine aminotransferase [Cytobacillus firmus]|uniref:D-alanine aminotransferase n=1 Tax=Cytobacillus firmus TaxID=1399 RepID=A0A380Y1M2_CYTFI|nr:D-amino-acid transaminase [Cytobacillus firmus]KAF0823563.1 D-alanine aminotransferase [Cytobacillus firmus]MBG9543950.1 D-alanine aminotransferase [Cytobacillus firmus]MBG9547656.1 D-alanine aminotransferase [Cytobacillus firmus]MBG9551988.1 D-alanine aminotransferase [Cytobacillus firmus]MBG9557814.1 D-alanine aminotransferase [Cytobacillus firmus]
MEYVILNGDLIERSEAKVDIEDRGYQFGDGVYEVIRVYNGKMFTADEHLERLLESGKKIELNIPYSKDQLKQMLAEMIERNNLELGIVYMQFSRGTSPRNHAYPGADVAPVLTAYTRETTRPVGSMRNGVKAILIEDIRWLRCDIKSLNLLGNIMAKQKAAQSGCFEAIQHRGDTVTEGSSSNIAIVKDGTLYTHPATNLILNGITRRKINEICRENGIALKESAFSKEDLLAADEVFMSSTSAEITPITEIEGKPVGNGSPGLITNKLQNLFEDAIEKQCGSLTVKIR